MTVLIDRIPSAGKSNRKLITPEGGGTPYYAKVEYADDPIVVGTPLNRQNVIDTASIGLPTIKSKTIAPWALIQSYLVAGTYTFIAPDLLGDGSSYEIGVYAIGGGGSGGAVSVTTAHNFIGIVSGGASGYTKVIKLTVTPNQSISIVVGAGGASVTAAAATADLNPVYGLTGGSTSFNGVVVNGGDGGQSTATNPTVSAYIGGSNGGQGSDAIFWNSIQRLIAPAMGENTLNVFCSGSTCQYFIKGGNSRFSDVLNPFDLLKRLGAGGGGVGSNYGGSQLQTTPTLDDGSKAGNAAYNSTGGNATGNGNGGGSAIASNMAATSGKGSDGAVFIYARRVG